MRIDEHETTWNVVSAELNKRIAKLVDELTSPSFKHDQETDTNRRTKLFELRDLMDTFTKPGVTNE
jgi:hypothetical protein